MQGYIEQQADIFEREMMIASHISSWILSGLVKRPPKPKHLYDPSRKIIKVDKEMKRTEFDEIYKKLDPKLYAYGKTNSGA